MSNIRRAIILAAGRGTRMGEITRHKHKLALPFANHCLLDRLLTTLVYAGIQELVVITGYLSDQIAELIRKFQLGSHFATNIRVVKDPNPIDTLSSLRCVREFVGDEPFLVIEGSVLVSINFLRKFCAYDFVSDKVVAVIGVTTAMMSAPTHSVACISSNGVVLEVVSAHESLKVVPDTKSGRLMGVSLVDSRIFSSPLTTPSIAQGISIMMLSNISLVHATWDDGYYRHFATTHDFEHNDASSYQEIVCWGTPLISSRGDKR